MNFFERRRLRKNAKEVLRQALHLRNVRGDVLSATDLQKLQKAETELADVVKAADYQKFDKSTDDLYAVVNKLTPLRPWRAFSENFEILIVAVAVAWGFRAYFIQPFKIPTGSMQPTLYGVHSEAGTTPGLFDKLPLSPIKWIITGKSYTEIRAMNSGDLSNPITPQGMEDQTVVIYYIGDGRNGVRYELPRDVKLTPGKHVQAGDVLWRGTVTVGDHVFVNKMAWNFRKPRLGEIMVFTTDGIQRLTQGQHYIKRLTGLPGNTIAIKAPNLLINGEVELNVPGIKRVASMQEPGYSGYLNAEYLAPGLSTNLASGQYWAMGDNTRSSFDSRYWGAVPDSNMVGPAFFVYWPISERFGLAR